MGTQPQTDSTANVRLEQAHRAAPIIDPAQFWSKDNQVRAKLTLGPTQDELLMKPLWGNDGRTTGTPRAGENTPIDGRDERFVLPKELTNPSRWVNPGDVVKPKDVLNNPGDDGTPKDVFIHPGVVKPKDVLNNPGDDGTPKDVFIHPKDVSINPKDLLGPEEPADSQKQRDQRDADTMMDALRHGNLADLKSLVGDMTPAKMKRVTEQLKAEGFDIQCGKDGKLVVFNKDLGLGVSVGQDGKAEVVKKDKDGNIFPSADGLDPEKLLKNFSTQMPSPPLTEKDIAKIIEEDSKHDPFHLRERRDPYKPYYDVPDRDLLFQQHSGVHTYK